VKLSNRVKVLVVGAASVVTFLAAAPMIGGASLSHELGSERPVGNCSSVGSKSSVGGQSCTGPSTMITLSSSSLTGYGKETITGKQFVVGEKVYLYLTNDSGKLDLLGKVRAKTGSFRTKVEIAGVTAGTHTIVATGSKNSFASVNFEMLPDFLVFGSPVAPGTNVKSRLAAFHPKSTLSFFLFRNTLSGYCPVVLPLKAVALATSPAPVVTAPKGRTAGTARATVSIPAKTTSGRYAIEVLDQAGIRDCSQVWIK